MQTRKYAGVQYYAKWRITYHLGRSIGKREKDRVPVSFRGTNLVSIRWHTRQQTRAQSDRFLLPHCTGLFHRFSYADISAKTIVRPIPCQFLPILPISIFHVAVFFFYFFFSFSSMVRLQNRISVGLEVLQYFTTREWVFHNTNLLIMWGEMSAEDKKIFPIDFLSIDDATYIKTCILGARQYCMKENLSTLPKARRHQAMYVFQKYAGNLKISGRNWRGSRKVFRDSRKYQDSREFRDSETPALNWISYLLHNKFITLYRGIAKCHKSKKNVKPWRVR